MRRTLHMAALLFLVAAGTASAPPAAGPAGSIAGSVTCHGFPVKARVEVRLLRPIDPEEPMPLATDVWRPPMAGGPPLAVIETDEQGGFTVAVFSPGDYEVLVAAPWGEVVRLPVEVARPGLRADGSAGLIGAARILRGTARWSDGRPFLGTVVVGSAAAPTDGEGRFSIEGAPVAGGLFLASAPGTIVRVFAAPPAEEEGDLRIVVDEDLRPISGRILAAGTGDPVAGADILAEMYDAEGRVTKTGARTGPDGRFDVPAGARARLTARAAGFLPVEVPVTEGGGPLELSLLPAPRLSGRVVSPATGATLPGVPVYVLEIVHDPMETGRFAEAGILRVVSDSTGRFELECPVAGDVMVFAHGRGLVSPGLEEATGGGYNPLALTLSPGERREVSVEAVPSPSIAGRLAGPDGRGIAGVRIGAALDEGIGEPAFQWRFSLDMLTGAVTDADGAYRIPTVMPGLRYRVAAEPIDRPGAPAAVSAPVTGTEARVDLTLPGVPDRYVVARVLDGASGKPLEGARVYVGPPADREDQSAEGEGAATSCETTGADGRARVGPFPPGRLVASAAHRAHAGSDDVSVPGSDGESRELAVELTLAPGKVLAGQVLLPDRTPPPRWWFAVTPPGARERFLTVGGAGGRFRVEHLREGDYEVVALASDAKGGCFHATVRAIAGREDLVIVLAEEDPNGWLDRNRAPAKEGGPALLLRIHDAAGNSVARGTVWCYPVAEFTEKETLCAPTLSSFEKGSARIVFDAYEKLLFVDVHGESAEGLRYGPVLAGPFGPGEQPADIVLGAPTAVGGVVLGPGGEGIRGAHVLAVPENEDLLSRGGDPNPHGMCWADSAGRFRIDGLGAGRYLLAVDGPGALVNRTLRGVPPGAMDVEIRLA
ncbi:MAG: carboxypeptidase-like regulatory domain-containing protein, partial [Planctomycetes bacterium]|nr:carboxypeptidase-like regulatory domain-containing protein [Planctomycetota bacterium]